MAGATLYATVQFGNDNKIAVEILDDETSGICSPSAFDRDTYNSTGVRIRRFNIISGHIRVRLICVYTPD